MGVLRLACETDAVATSPRGDVGLIHTESSLSVANVEQSLGSGCSLIDVVDVPMGWVVKLPKRQ